MTSCTGAGGQTGTKYTYAQLEGLWIKAGGPKAEAPLAAAIGMAESGGCSAALNPTDNNGTQTSWGIWQISNGTHNQPVQNILDPATNAQQAVAKYKDAGGFSPWGTYSSGAYKRFLSNSTTPDTNVPGTGKVNLDSSGGSNPAGDCLIGGGNIAGVVSYPCLMTRKGARELIGGACLIGAGILGLAAMVILAASAFNHPMAKSAVGSVAPVRGVVGAVTPAAREERRLSRSEARTRLDRRRGRARAAEVVRTAPTNPDPGP